MTDSRSSARVSASPRTRRSLLAAVGAATSLGMAGCNGPDEPAGTPTGQPAGTTTAAEPTGTPTAAEPTETTGDEDPCAGGTTVELGTDRRFLCFDYGFTDPAETVQDEPDDESRARNLVAASVNPYVSPHSGRRYHLFEALINAEFSTQGYPSNDLTARSRWGQSFPVEGTDSREATVTVQTTTEPTIVFDEKEYALLLNVHPELRGATAEADLTVVLEDLTDGETLFEEVIYEERIDGDSEQQWTYGERDTYDTEIAVTLSAGHTYRAYSQVGVRVARGVAGYHGYPPSVVASFEATLNEIQVAFD